MKLFLLDLNYKRYWEHFGSRTRLLSVVSLLAFVALLSTCILTAINLQQPASYSPTPDAAVLASLTPTPAAFGFQSEETTVAAASNVTTTANPAQNVSQAEAVRWLSVADGFLNNGQYVEAVAEYRLLLQKYPKSPQAPSAAYSLARATQKRGQLAGATQLYQQFLTQYTSDGRKPLAYLALGDLAQAQGHWNEALDYYQKYQKEATLLSSYVNIKIAGVYQSTLQKDQAVVFYQKAAEGQATSLERVQAMEDLGDYYAKANSYDNAVNWYNKVLDLAKLPDYRAAILAKIAAVYTSANQSSQADTINSQLVEQYPDTAPGQRAFKRLATANSNLLDNYERGYMHWLNSEYTEATKDFNTFLGRSDPNTSIPDPTNASPEILTRRAWAWFYMARSYELGGDLPKAITEYRALQNHYPQAEMSPEALWHSAATLEKAGAIQDALNEYAKVAATYPKSSYATDALVAEARILQQKGGPDAAKPVLDTLSAKYPASAARSQVLYNMARTYGANGNMSAARTALTQAAQGVSEDYYTMRAQELLSTNDIIPPPSNALSHPAVYDAARFQADINHDRTEMENWLAHWAVIASTNTNSVAAPSQQVADARTRLTNDPALARLSALQQVGWDDEASREAKELVDNYSTKPLELYFLAVELNQRGEYYYSIGAAKQLLTLAQNQNLAIGIRNVPLLLQKLIYPLNYQDIVLEQSKDNNIDPLLLLSLIKQESSFRPDVASGADARGLTQVIPSTGAAIAANLGKPNFSADDLYQPYTSIQFGAYYLANRLKDYKGEPCEALAAYNGGEGNVNKWAAAHPPSSNLDDFVENIPYAETRQYVKIVYSNYAMYRQIYSVKTAR